MKIKDLQTAMKLAKITNRPLEDFYDGPIEDQNTQQETEEVMATGAEESESVSEMGIIIDIPKVRNTEAKSARDTSRDAELILRYGGKMSDNGKLICETKQMTKKEYLTETKGLNDKDILAHPLLYVMFRSEGQTEGHFVQWLSKFAEE
jgi:hypothetical protein